MTAHHSSPLWYPCTQMKDMADLSPLEIIGAEGSYIYLKDGRKIIDAISSWWCKSLGHGHPILREALIHQAKQFEHVILADTHHDVIGELSERLCQLSPTLKKVFYTGDGSTAVEVALKMSLHYRFNRGQSRRQKFIALQNSYHGESLLCLSVSDLGLYRDAYNSVLFESEFLNPLPYVSGREDESWNNAETSWPEIEKRLSVYAETATAIIVEPILQGAGGMKVYSPDLLRRLRQWCDDNDVHLIADEILTGFGRTGLPLACQHANIEPDIACLGKGLTAGWLPMSCVLVNDNIYDAFYDDDRRRAFLHSNTFAGNPLAASVALATLKCLESENIYSKATALEIRMRELFQEVAKATGMLKNIRGIGGVVAADLSVEDESRRLGYQVYQRAKALGALLRPLGNTIYWLPPLNISEVTLQELKAITTQSILESC
jgi:adenosylmethionine-8-amino-7-oxononanoate aminotransferase